ncbi:MAG: ABC transporter ATP-binding protein [Pseudomonadota bacterium]
MREVLQVNNLVKRFGGLTATDNLNFSLREGEIHAVIGPNGAGKTTFIHQLAGEIAPTAGSIVLEGQEITRLPVHKRALAGIGRSYQISSVFKNYTVLQNVMLAVQAAQGSSFKFWKPVMSDKQLFEPANAILDKTDLLREANVLVGNLAHGVMRQLEIAMVLAMQPRVLLLDEPMAGMSHSESGDIVKLLATLKGKYSIVLIEHDMDAVFALADRISVLVYGRVIACGTPAEIRGSKEVREAYLGDDHESD